MFPKRRRMPPLAVFITLALLAAPLAVEAQQAGKVYRIGILAQFGPNVPESARLWDGLLQGLRELGYVEGQNLVVEGRYAEGKYERLPALAAELVRLPVDVIVTPAPPTSEAARRATSTIPIVLTNHPDPVGSGLATSLGRPSGNVTGLSSLAPQLLGKQMELLKEAMPRRPRVAVLSNPTNPFHARSVTELDFAARSLGFGLRVLEAQAPSDFAGAFSAMTNETVGALIITDPMFFGERARIAELALKHRLPMITAQRDYVEAGGLMAYGPDVRYQFRRAATYVDKILRGARPGDLPIEQPTKFELVINLKTAKALGLTIPQSVLLRADEVIQ
jgi:putative tryptophan/tyrosine transport system substrate-binding protein